MPLAGKLARVAVFLGVVLLVIAGSTAGSLVADVASPPAEPVAYPEYNASAIVPERVESGGAPAVEPIDDERLVLVDRAHANRFRPDEIQPLLSAIADTGAEVEYLETRGEMDDALARADAFVVVDPGMSYSTDEADQVEAFVERGGRLALLGEPTHLETAEGDFGAILAPAHNQLGTLATRFGLEFGTAYLFNMERNDGNFRSIIAEAGGDGPLAAGVEEATFPAAVPVDGPDAEPVLVATDGTRTSRSDDTGEFVIAAQAGSVVAVGDTSFLQHGNYNVLDTEAFIANLAAFLAAGEHERALRQYPAVVDTDPTIRYTAPGLLDAAQTLRGSAAGRSTIAMARDDVTDGTDVLVTTFAFLDENDVGGTGIDVRGDVVLASGYRGGTAGVAVIRAPADGEVDLVIAADGPARAERAAQLLADGRIEEHAIDDRTAVLRTAAAPPPSDNRTGSP